MQHIFSFSPKDFAISVTEHFVHSNYQIFE